MYSLPENWTYRSEGNCNVVISLPNSGKVLCIRKTTKKHSVFQQIYDLIINWLAAFGILLWEIRNVSTCELQFCTKVMGALLGYNYVPDIIYVHLTHKQILSLEKQLDDIRPAKRKHKILSSRAALVTDFALIPSNYVSHKMCKDSYGIEIKPKQGMRLPNEELYKDCLYCMNQRMKLKKGEIKQISSYCPEHLFSGENPKMVEAIKALMQNPQNNLKIFKNGNLIYGENMSEDSMYQFLQDLFGDQKLDINILMDEFCLLLQRSLIRELSSANFVSLCSVHQGSSNSSLPKHSVLGRIFLAQLLNRKSSEFYAYHLESSELADGIQYVNTLLKILEKKPKTACIKCLLTGYYLKELNLQFVPYLISAVANDCSLMVSLRKIEENIEDNQKNIIGSQFGSFALKVGIFDLYPKPVSTIFKHIERNKEALKVYLTYSDNSKRVK